jgi:excisionase family DNA binding protein
MHSSATRPPESDSLFTKPSTGSEPLLVGVEEAARLLNVCSRTLWTLTQSGNLPHLRIGRRVLYPVEGLRRWIADRTSGGVSA